MEPSTIVSRIADAEAAYGSTVTNRYRALHDAEEFSTEQIKKVREELAANPPPASLGVHALATAGSLARLEASSLSDLDMIIVTDAQSEGETSKEIATWRDALCLKWEWRSRTPMECSTRRSLGAT